MFTQHCAKCHKHGSDGTAIGPDLTGFGVHPKEELVIAILDPSRSVEGNFKLYRVQTNDDRSISWTRWRRSSARRTCSSTRAVPPSA
jgi:uncharacterized protein